MKTKVFVVLILFACKGKKKVRAKAKKEKGFIATACDLQGVGGEPREGQGTGTLWEAGRECSPRILCPSPSPTMGLISTLGFCHSDRKKGTLSFSYAFLRLLEKQSMASHFSVFPFSL